MFQFFTNKRIEYLQKQNEELQKENDLLRNKLDKHENTLNQLRTIFSCPVCKNVLKPYNYYVCRDCKNNVCKTCCFESNNEENIHICKNCNVNE